MLDDRLLAAARGHVRQIETLRDLETGHYSAVTTVGDAFAQCAVGLGVAEAADGEIVAVDGTVWRIPADGRPVVAPTALGLPFAVSAVGGTPVVFDLAAGPVETSIAEAIGELHHDSRKSVLALRVDGRFRDVLLRSEPRQEPPYKILADVLDHEVRFAFDRWNGTLVGFRFAETGDHTVIPGLHLHAIAADRASGGHCHRAEIDSARLTAWLDDVQIVVPH